MVQKIRIISGNTFVDAELYDKPTARAVWKALPLEGRVNTWGEEIYFSIPVEAETEPDARAEMDIGELGYWPAGSAFCIFFGPTPASTGAKPMAASPVNILGRVIGDASVLRSVQSGEVVRVEPTD